MRRFPILVALASLAIATVLRLVFCGEGPPALMWDGPSYLDAAARLAEAWPSPPTLDFRAPGYPALLALFFRDGSFDLAALALAQRLLGLASILLLCLLSFRFLQHRLLQLLCIGAWVFSLDALFMEEAVYSETLATFLLLGAACAASAAVGSRGAAPNAAACLLLTLAVFVRPALQVLFLPFLAIQALRALRRGIHPASALLPFLIPLLAVGGYAFHNKARTGQRKAFMGAGFSSLNYVTNPLVYRNLPPRWSHLREVLLEVEERAGFDHSAFEGVRPGVSDLFGGGPRTTLGWDRGLQPLLEAQRSVDPSLPGDWDRAALRISTSVLPSVFPHYAAVWTSTMREYATQYTVLFGLYRDESSLSPENARVGPSMYAAVKKVERSFGLFLPFVVLAVFPLLVLLPLRRGADGGRRRALLLLALWVVLAMLASTAVEPSNGQARYRLPLQPLHLLLACALAGSLAAGVGRKARSPAPPPPSRPAAAPA